MGVSVRSIGEVSEHNVVSDHHEEVAEHNFRTSVGADRDSVTLPPISREASYHSSTARSSYPLTMLELLQAPAAGAAPTREANPIAVNN